MFICLFDVVVDGDDRTQCCASKGITGRCLNICSGNVDNFPANLMDCQRHAYSFASCYDVHLPTGLLPAPSMFLPVRRSVSAVFATATCPSVTAGIVSKRIKISSNFFLGLVAPPRRFSNTTYDCEIITGRDRACHSGGLR